MNKLLQQIKKNDERFNGVGKKWESDLGKLLNRFASCIRDNKKGSKDCIQKRIEIKNFVYFFVKSHIIQSRISELEALVEEVKKERDEFLSVKPADEIEEVDERAYVAGLNFVIQLLKTTINKLKSNL